MRKCTFVAACVGLMIPCMAQPAISWQRNYGGSSLDDGYSITPTADGGYFVLGETISNDVEVSGWHGQLDLWVIRLDSEGELQWQRCLGGSDQEAAGEIKGTMDGGCIVIGSTRSLDGDVTINHGGYDAWVIKLSSSGDVEWESTYGGIERDEGHRVIILASGEYLFFGMSASPNIPGHHGDKDLWLARISASGELLQQRCYGGSEQEIAGSFTQCLDGRLLLCGATSSSDGDVVGFDAGNAAWVIAVDGEFDLLWQICLGGTGSDNARAICVDENGLAFVAVASSSDNGDISDPWGEDDFWIVKLSLAGEVVDEASFGGTAVDAPRSILHDGNDAIYVHGISYSDDGLVNNSKGGADAWLLRLEEGLELTWERSFGGNDSESGRGICKAPDGYFALVNTSSSSDQDVTGNFGNGDVWVVKFEADDVGLAEDGGKPDLHLAPNPTMDVLRIEWIGPGSQPLEVFDALGRSMPVAPGISGRNGRYELDVSDWAEGMYTVHARSANGIAVAGFVKQ